MAVAAAVAFCCGCAQPLADLPASIRLTPGQATLSVDDFPDGRGVIDLMIHNQSPETATIESAETSCACAVAQFPGAMLIPSGQTATVRILADLGGLGDRLATVKVAIVSGGRRQWLASQLTLHGKRMVPPLLDRMPELVELKQQGDELFVEREFAIRTFEWAASEPWLAETQIDAGGLLVTSRVVSQSPVFNDVVRRDYVLLARADTTRLRSRAFLFAPRTSEPSRNIISPARIVYHPWRPLSAVPEELFVVAEGETPFPIRRRIRVYAEDPDEPISITRASSDADWLAIESVPPENGSGAVGLVAQYDVTVTRAPVAQSGSVSRALIALETGNPRMRAFQVAVSLLNQRGAGTVARE